MAEIDTDFIPGKRATIRHHKFVADSLLALYHERHTEWGDGYRLVHVEEGLKLIIAQVSDGEIEGFYRYLMVPPDDAVDDHWYMLDLNDGCSFEQYGWLEVGMPEHLIPMAPAGLVDSEMVGEFCEGLAKAIVRTYHDFCEGCGRYIDMEDGSGELGVVTEDYNTSQTLCCVCIYDGGGCMTCRVSDALQCNDDCTCESCDSDRCDGCNGWLSIEGNRLPENACDCCSICESNRDECGCCYDCERIDCECEEDDKGVQE